MNRLYTVLILFLINTASGAQNWLQMGQDLEGTAANDFLGQSVSLSSDGNIAAIGAPYNGSGYVRIFMWAGGSWIQRGGDLIGKANGDRFGYAVALSEDGNTVAIGAPFNDDNLVNSGQVQVYDWNGNAWIQRGGDFNGAAAYDEYGYSISLSSDGHTVAISGPNNDISNNNAGHVRVHDWHAGSQAWIQRGADIHGEAPEDHSGLSIAMSSDGNIVAIGAILNDDGGDKAGHVRVYVWNGTIWVQRGNDIDGRATFEGSGRSVSLSSDGNTVTTSGAANTGLLGHVRTFDWIGGSWIQRGNDLIGVDVNGTFGWSSSLSADGMTVAVGARSKTSTGDRYGQVRIYEWLNGQWVQSGNDMDGKSTFEWFGHAVALASDGHTVAVGAPRRSIENEHSVGAVQIFSDRPQIVCPGDTTVDCGAATDTAFLGSLSNLLLGPGESLIVENDSMGFDGTCNNYTVGYIDRHFMVQNDNTSQRDTVCMQRITVVDTIPPTLVCAADTILDCTTTDIDTALLGVPMVSDECDANPVLSYRDDSTGFDGTCSGDGVIGQITRRFFATDLCGNVDSCDQVITFVDTTAPALACAPDTILDCTVTDIDTALLGVPLVSDDCDANPVLTYRDDSTGFDGMCSGDGVIGQITRRFYATDLCGNVDSCDQVLTFVDTTAPTLVCVPDTTLDCTVTDIDTAILGVPLVSDDCDANPVLTYRDDSTGFDGSCSGDGVIGQITRRFYATDLCGNVDSCDQVLTFVDTTAPTLVCVADTTLDCAVTAIDTALLGVPMVSDDCDVNPVLTYRDDSTGFDGSCSGDGVIGQITRRFFATDLCGNVDSCDQVITFVDTTAPVVIYSPGDTTVDCSVAVPPLDSTVVVAMDPCSESLTYLPASSIEPGNCSNSFTIFQSLQILDQCGNDTTVSRTVTVIDTIPPTPVSCPTQSIINCLVGDPLPINIPSYTDNCSPTDSIVVTMRIDSVGFNTIATDDDTVFIHYFAEDECGNVDSTCTQIVVCEYVCPTINCHGMVNVGFGPNCMIEITPEMVLTQPLDSFAARFTTVTLTNQFGGVIPDNLLSYKDRGRTFTATIRSDIPGCGYYECSTQVVVDDQAGSLRFVSAFQSNLPGDAMVYNLNTPSASNYSEMTGPHISQGKMNVYCGQIPDPSEHTPLVMDQCTGQQYTPKVQPDWVMMPNACGEGDTAKVIWRTWESFDKNGQLTTLTDTIVVFRLPQLSQEDFLAAAETEFFCKVEAGVEPGDALKRYAAWKQPVGIHDYEYPHSKLRGVIYDLPLTVIKAGLDHAESQGTKIFAEYLECVILQKADGTLVTIKDIITGDYGDDVIENATPEQIGYGLLHDILEGGVSPTSWNYGGTNYTFVPYLLLQEGDLVLSEGGTFVQVDSKWFYNGHGNSPFWFSGGWPSIYGSGDCVNYCDFGAGDKFDCVRVRVPGLTIAEGISTNPELCENMCLKEGVHCGIQIRQESVDWSGSCPQTRGLDTYVTQTCWATTPNACAVQSENPSEAVVDYEATDKSIKIHISEWQTLVDTMGPIFDFCYPSDWDQEAIQESIHDGAQYGGAAEWEFDNPTTYRVGTHECAAEVYVPSVQVVDNCSGVHAVKAMVEVQGGTRAVALELTNTETKTLASGEVCTVYTYSHTADPITIPFSGCDGELTEVVYEAADNCWNQSTWSKFIRVTDDVPPTVVVDRNLNVTLADKIAWVPAVNWDEGSWDNCAIDLRLGRRSDWWTETAMVDLCAELGPNAPYDNWVDLLDDLGVDRKQAGTAVGGGTVGETAFNNAYNVNDLQTFLSDGEVEKYYFHQIQWLWEDEELCGEKVVHAWIYSVAEYIAENCSVADDHGNPLNVRDLEEIFDNLSGVSGYGNELSLMGGGWSKSVPFKCVDACEAVPVELLVLDYCCNWGIGRSTMNVEDAGNSKLVTRLPDLDISCESYNLFYKDVVEAAAVFGENGSGADTIGAFADVDAALGEYILTWVDNQNRPTDIDGNLLPEDSTTFNYWNVTCEEKSETEKVAIDNLDGTIGWETIIHNTTYLDTATSTAPNGIVAINCSGTLSQDIWVDLDECGQGTITRRFFISGGCDDDISPEWEFHQVINVHSACGMRESMFDLPANVGTKNEPICLPQGLSRSYLPDTIGALTVKPHLEGKLCNSFASGSEVKEFDVPNSLGMKKYLIEWTMIDWCAHHTSTNREFSYTQEVIATINPDCDVTTDTGDDTTDVSLVQGTIATERGEAVQNVEMKAVLGSGSPLTTVTGGEGAYNFSINNGSQVSLVPSKNTGFANGVSTQDLIAIQRHVLQKKALDSKYQRIAADVDGNGSINGFDVLELRKLVMQPHTKFANNTSWRFFDKQTDKEVYDVANVNGDMNVDFVGVKIGDVNLSSSRQHVGSRSTTGTLNLNMADKAMKGGEVYRIDVTSDNFVNINGMQYTLSYVTNLVEIESIEAGALNITKDNYVRYAPGVITSSWSEADGQHLSSDEVLFTLVVKAKSEVRLRDALSLNNRVTTTEAYDAEGGLKAVSLRFDGSRLGDGTEFALYQNTPNPYAGETVIGFHLPETSEAVMTVYDVTGRLIKRINGEYEAGYNEVRLTSTDLGVTGVLYYQLDTKKYTATKKMIVIE